MSCFKISVNLNEVHIRAPPPFFEEGGCCEHVDFGRSPPGYSPTPTLRITSLYI